MRDRSIIVTCRIARVGPVILMVLGTPITHPIISHHITTRHRGRSASDGIARIGASASTPVTISTIGHTTHTTTVGAWVTTHGHTIGTTDQVGITVHIRRSYTLTSTVSTAMVVEAQV